MIDTFVARRFETMGMQIMRLLSTKILALLALAVGGFVSTASAQTEVVTVQGSLPRFNYRDPQGNLMWALPANSVLWKLDGPSNAGVIVCTAAAASNSITLNEGGVGICGTGFPSAKLHVGTIGSVSRPGEVRIDPGNPDAPATIHALNASTAASILLETQSPSNGASLQLKSTISRFTQSVATNFVIRDNINAVNSFVISPSNKNANSLVIKNGNIGMGVANPTSPLVLANGAKCTAGGVWTNASSRELKDNIESLALEKAQEALAGLQPVTYHYKAEPEEQQVGFIAEDVPHLVATNSRQELSPMDVVAVLTKVVQDQQTRLDAQAEQLKQQAILLEKQSELLERLSEKLN